MDNVCYREALEAVWDIFRFLNGYIDQQKPWKQIKNNKDGCLLTMQTLVAVIRAAALYLKPFCPSTAQKIYSTFVSRTPQATWEYLESLAFNNGSLRDDIFINPASLVDGKYPVLFQRMV